MPASQPRPVPRMARKIIDKIRKAIRTGEYDLTYHANEEMAEDNLGIMDIESTILNGRVVRTEKDEALGSKYVIEGIGVDYSTSIGIVALKKPVFF